METECLECGAKHSADVWLIVDAAERPDLWQYCREGSIHAVTCPNGHVTYLATHLLLHDAARRRVLFSPVPQPDSAATRHDIAQAIPHLVGKLRNALPAAADTSYLRMVRVVARVDLPRAMDDEDDEEAVASGSPPLPGALSAAEQVEIAANVDAPAGPKDMLRRIRVIEEALQRVTREQNPGFWAWLQGRLGTSYLKAADGDPAANLERGIGAMEAALTALTRDAWPDEWANQQINLGTAYLRRHARRGACEDLTRALAASKAALTVYTREEVPERWELAQQNLRVAESELRLAESPGLKAWVDKGRRSSSAPAPPTVAERQPGAPPSGRLAEIFGQLALPDGAIDPSQRIRLTREALELTSRAERPETWATLQFSLGNDLARGQGETPDQDLEQAIAAYTAALSVFARTGQPHERMAAYYNLGVVYLDRLRGDPAENWRNATTAFDAALAVVTRESDPVAWARLQYNIGDSCQRSPSVERYERSINALEAALTVYTKESFPTEWATTHARLGDVYGKRLRGGAENSERAIRSYDAALTVFDQRGHAERWAEVQRGRAWAYAYRIEGDAADNKERALEACRAVLSVYTLEEHPTKWAGAQTALGAAYFDRQRGTPAVNLQLALEAHRAALIVRTKDGMPAAWALTQYEMGLVYFRKSFQDDAEDNLERAIGCYEAALSVYAGDPVSRSWEDRVNWASMHLALGQAYRKRARGDPADNLERAIAAYEATLTVITLETYPGRVRAMVAALGEAYAERVRGERADNLGKAAGYLREALDATALETFPQEARMFATALARVEGERQNWTGAHSALQTAIEAAERLYGTAVTEANKAEEIGDTERLFRTMVRVCLRLDPPRPREALEYAERGRSRLLRDQLGALPLPPPRGVPQSVVALEEELLARLRALQNTTAAGHRGAADPRASSDELRVTLEKLNGLWDSLQQRYHADHYVALRRGESVEWDEIQRWLGAQGCRAAVLEFFTVEEGVVAFVCREGAAAPVAVLVPLPPGLLDDVRESLAAEVRNFDPAAPRAETWQRLSPILLADVMAHLGGVELLYIVPHGALHNLPLHALEHQGKPLIEHFPIAYAPSLSAAIRAVTSPPDEAPDAGARRGTLVVGNPTADLPFAEEEAVAVGDRFGVWPLVGDKATKAQVQRELGIVGQAHLAAHASFSSDDPFGSGIELTAGETLTARDVMAQRLGAELMTLSACETGVQAVRAGDELMGLNRAFLYAGVRTLVVSLWRVDDVSTKELMVRFYDHLYDGEGVKRASPAHALRAAMLETRAEWGHTYYWAPFVLSGDWR